MWSFRPYLQLCSLNIILVSSCVAHWLQKPLLALLHILSGLELTPINCGHRSLVFTADIGSPDLGMIINVAIGSTFHCFPGQAAPERLLTGPTALDFGPTGDASKLSLQASCCTPCTGVQEAKTYLADWGESTATAYNEKQHETEEALKQTIKEVQVIHNQSRLLCRTSCTAVKATPMGGPPCAAGWLGRVLGRALRCRQRLGPALSSPLRGPGAHCSIGSGAAKILIEALLKVW